MAQNLVLGLLTKFQSYQCQRFFGKGAAINFGRQSISSPDGMSSKYTKSLTKELLDSFEYSL